VRGVDRTAELRRTVRHALLGAAALAAALVLCWLAVFHIGYVQHVDASIFDGFSTLRGRPHVSRLASWLAGLCDPSSYVFLCVIPVGIALARRRPWLAVAILAILGGANLTTEVLKPLLAAPRPQGLPAWQISQASWPSGHATASMALALGVVLACPGRLRPYAAACGAAFALAVSYSFLTLGWHYPSDALAGFLVASLWTLLGIAALAAVEARRPGAWAARPVQLVWAKALRPPAAVLAGALVLGCLAAIVHPGAVVSYARLHTAFVVGAASLGALALALSTGVMLTLRSPPGRAPSGGSPTRTAGYSGSR
jgi:membrane-associated phospholipid phosphatase